MLADYKNKLMPVGLRATTLSMDNLLQATMKPVIIVAVGLLTTSMSTQMSHIVIAVVLAVAYLVMMPFIVRAFRKSYTRNPEC